MDDPSLLMFLASRGFASLSAWCRAARVPVGPLYQARHGRQKLATKYVAKLARAAGEPPGVVLAILGLAPSEDA